MGFFHIKKLPSERYTNPAPEANSGFLNGVEVTLRGEIPNKNTHNATE